MNPLCRDQGVGLMPYSRLALGRLAWAWLLSRPGVVAPVVGATRAEHLEDAIAALSIHLTNDEVRLL